MRIRQFGAISAGALAGIDFYWPKCMVPMIVKNGKKYFISFHPAAAIRFFKLRQIFSAALIFDRRVCYC
jgi:hypothetical protein